MEYTKLVYIRVWYMSIYVRTVKTNGIGLTAIFDTFSYWVGTTYLNGSCRNLKKIKK